MLKESLWGYQSPSKDSVVDEYEDNFVFSPNKNNVKAKKHTTKLLKFNCKRSDKEN
jgi:hypothetical protein